MKKILLTVLTVLFAISAFAFPLKTLKEGDKVDLKQFTYPAGAYTDKQDKAEFKLLLLWKEDKRLSKNAHDDVKSLCEKYTDIVCVAVQPGIDNTKKPENRMIYATDKAKITDSWGIFTLPVTLVLDGSNNVIFGLGVEGQFKAKLEKYLEFKKGIITEEEYKRITGVQGVDKTVSKLPEINFSKNLIKGNNKEEALKRLEAIDADSISDNEKAKLAESYIMLKDYDTALNILLKASNKTPDVRFLLGYTYVMLGQPEESLAEIDTVKDIYPAKERVYYVLAKIYYGQKKYKEAADYYEKCCSLTMDF
jgi:tetratricopeptide (TPR) repeat protein